VWCSVGRFFTGYRHSPTYAISALRNFKKEITLNNNTFETRAEFFLSVMQAQLDEDGGRILLGDKRVAWR
jgi:hypothetical protein